MMNLILKRYIYICKLAVQTESVLEFLNSKAGREHHGLEQWQPFVNLALHFPEMLLGIEQKDPTEPFFCMSSYQLSHYYILSGFISVHLRCISIHISLTNHSGRDHVQSFKGVLGLDIQEWASQVWHTTGNEQKEQAEDEFNIPEKY